MKFIATTRLGRLPREMEVEKEAEQRDEALSMGNKRMKCDE